MNSIVSSPWVRMGIKTLCFNIRNCSTTFSETWFIRPQTWKSLKLLVGDSGKVRGLSMFSCLTQTGRTKRYQTAALLESKKQISVDRSYVLGNEENMQQNQKLYPTHISTTSFQKLLLGVGASVMALADPRRADMVAVSGETLGQYALKIMLQKMKANPEGQQILQERPQIHSKTTDLKYLKSLPDYTLGRTYIKFLEDNTVTPDSRDPVHFVDSAELMYVMLRYRQVHDLLHAVLGMPTNMLGEVAVKWIEGIQTGLPMCLGGGFLGPLRFGPKQRKKYISTYLPWALKVGLNMKFYMNVYFENRWEQNIDKLKQELNIEPLTAK